jgi:hypothetical protein
VSLRLLAILMRWLLLGPWAEQAWESQVARTVDLIRSAAPAKGQVEGSWRSPQQRARLDGSGSLGMAGVRVSVLLRVEREEGIGPVRTSAGIGLLTGPFRFEAGPLRGGLGAGLLLGLDAADSGSAVPRGAWSGLPGRPRSGARTGYGSAPTGLVLSSGRFRAVVLPGRSQPLLAAGLGPEGCPGVVLAQSGPGRGVEVSLGRRTGAIVWRCSLGGWWMAGRNTHRNVQGVLSLTDGRLRASLAVWCRHGPPPPFARMDPGGDGCSGGRIAAAWSVPGGWWGALSLEVRSNGEGIRLQTADRYELVGRLGEGWGVRVRRSRIARYQEQAWQLPVGELASRTEVVLSRDPKTGMRSTAGWRQEMDGGGTGWAAWLRLERKRPAGTDHLTLTREEPGDGPPLWLWEPDPVQVGRLRVSDRPGWRCAIDTRRLTGPRIGLALGPGRRFDLVVGWSLGA